MKKQARKTGEPKVISGLYTDYFVTEREIESSGLHTHTFFELELFLCDGGVVYLNNEPFPIVKNSVCISVPTDHHRIETAEGKRIRLVNLSFFSSLLSKDLQSKLLYSPCTNVYYLGDEQAKGVEFLLAMLKAEQAKRADDSLAELCVQALLTLVLRERGDGQASRESGEGDTSLLAIQYLHDHFKENLSLEVVADEVGLNASYFSYLFHKQTGFSFKDYLTETRINYAKKLIRGSGQSLTYVCYESGFSSYSSFLRAFTKRVGASPREYADRFTARV